MANLIAVGPREILPAFLVLECCNGPRIVESRSLEEWDSELALAGEFLFRPDSRWRMKAHSQSGQNRWIGGFEEGTKEHLVVEVGKVGKVSDRCSGIGNPGPARGHACRLETG